jgi:hypothetical protein
VNGRTLSQGRSAPDDMKQHSKGSDLSIALRPLLDSIKVAVGRPRDMIVVLKPMT